MVLRVYVILLVVLLVGCVISAILEAEQKRRRHSEKKGYVKFINSAVEIMNFLADNYIALLIVYSIFMIGYSIVEKHWFFIVIPILFLLSLLFEFISEHCEILDFLTEALFAIFFILWIFYTFVFCMFAIDRPIKDEEITNKVDLVQTIDILEFKQVPYTNVEGRRYYIKSSPNSAYYYEVRTENGGTTTQVIDGSNNYVEKFESDEYADNPHIEVYRSYNISYYRTWYGNEVTKETSSSYSYYIYMPENSMFYEE